MLRQRIRCDAPSLSLADYNFIMQCHNDKPRSKVLNELKEKYSISQKRIYQIWRGEEKNRVAWDQPIYSFNSLFSHELEKREKSVHLVAPFKGALQEGGSDSKKENSDLNDQILAEPAFKNPSSNLSREDRDLNTFYEKEAIRDKKNIAKYLHILAK